MTDVIITANTAEEVHRMYAGQTPQGDCNLVITNVGWHKWRVSVEAWDKPNPRANDDPVTWSERWENIRKIWRF